MIVIVAVDTNGIPVGMVSDESYRCGLTPVEVPGDESQSCMKIMLFHLL